MHIGLLLSLPLIQSSLLLQYMWNFVLVGFSSYNFIQLDLAPAECHFQLSYCLHLSMFLLLDHLK